MDKWQQVYPITPPRIQVKPHEHSIVYRLVDNTVETLCGLTNKSALDACETPSYLVNDESRRTYRQVSHCLLDSNRCHSVGLSCVYFPVVLDSCQVLFQLASDILNKIGADVLEMSGTFQETMEKSVISLVQTRQISLRLLKVRSDKKVKLWHYEETIHF